MCVCQAVCTEHGSSATANRLFVRFCKLRSDSELEERARERENSNESAGEEAIVVWPALVE